jgi:hypothetical protein
MPHSNSSAPRVAWWNWRTQTWEKRRIAGSPMAQTVGVDGQPNGLWQIDWEDDDTTSYTVTHLPTGRQVFFYWSAAAALRAIGSGEALAKMDAEQPLPATEQVEVGAVAQ